MPATGASSVVPRDVDERRRMWQLVFAVWVSFANSALYGIGGYTSPILRAAPYNLTQADLALVSSVSGVFLAFGLPTGYVYDKYGAAACLRVGAVIAFIGYTMYALMFFGVIPLTLTTLLIAALPMNQYTNYLDTGSFINNLGFFARDKGTVILVEETFGAAIVASWYTGFFNNDTHVLLIVLPILCPAVAILASFHIERARIDEELLPWHGHRRFLVAYAIVGTSVAFYTAKAILGNFVNFSMETERVFAICGTVLVLLYVLIPTTMNGRGYKDPNVNGSFSFADLNVLEVGNDDNDDPNSLHSGQVDGPGVIQVGRGHDESIEETEHEENGIQSNEDALEATSLLPTSRVERKRSPLTMGRILRTPELWLVVFTTFCAWGTHGMVGANGAQIYQALNNGTLDKTTNALYMSAGSITSSIGRASVAILDRKIKNKAAMLCAGLCCIATASVLIPLLPLKAYIFAIALNGFGTSMWNASRALVLKQLFNGPSFGMVFNFIYTTTIPVPFLFNLGLFATMYDRETVKLTGNVHSICPSRSCVAPQLFIGAGVAFCGAAAALYLWVRTRRLLLQRKKR